MAPLPALKARAEERLRDLQAEVVKKDAEKEKVEADLAAKNNEESTAETQDAIMSLRSRREKLRVERKNLAGACSIIEKAVAKIKHAEHFGLKDPCLVHNQEIKVPEFTASKLLQDATVLEKLQKDAWPCELKFEKDSVMFVGEKAGVDKIKKALKDIEGDYEMWVESADDVALKLLDARGELKRLSEKHGVKLALDMKSIWVGGPPELAQQAAKDLRSKLQGWEDLACPGKLLKAAQAKARDVELDTGALIEVARGTIAIRGDKDSVQEALDALRPWLDEKEGVITDFVSVQKQRQQWLPETLKQMDGDLPHMAGKFGVQVRPANAKGEVEIRGPAEAVEAARAEYQMMLDFYEGKDAEQRGASKEAAPEPAPPAAAPEAPEDDWGAAPDADFAPASWAVAPKAEPAPAAWGAAPKAKPAAKKKETKRK